MKKKNPERLIGEKKISRVFLLWIPLILFLLFLLFPFYWTFVTSIKPDAELHSLKVIYWPQHPTFQAYQHLFNQYNFLHPMKNSFIVAAITTLVSLTVSTLAAYAFSRFRFAGRRPLMVLFLTNNMFPTVLLLIPLFTIMRQMKLLYTPWALVLPNCISVFNVIIMRSFFFGVPDSLREAAEIDGAGPIRTLVQIYLPLSLPVIATLALFYAVGRWNGFSDALMYLKKSSSEKYWPIQLLLYNVIKNSTQTSEQAAQEGFFNNGVSKTIQMATVMFATVPILLVYPWLQRYFVSGVTIGAVKG